MANESDAMSQVSLLSDIQFYQMDTVVCSSTYSLIDGSVIGQDDLIAVVLARKNSV